jgi:hypothetical protein
MIYDNNKNQPQGLDDFTGTECVFRVTRTGWKTWPILQVLSNQFMGYFVSQPNKTCAAPYFITHNPFPKHTGLFLGLNGPIPV